MSPANQFGNLRVLFRILPTPSSAEDINYIYKCVASLGKITYFKFPVRDAGKFTMNYPDHFVVTYEDEEVVEKLKNVRAIPRRLEFARIFDVDKEEYHTQSQNLTPITKECPVYFKAKGKSSGRLPFDEVYSLKAQSAEKPSFKKTNPGVKLDQITEGFLRNRYGNKSGNK